MKNYLIHYTNTIKQSLGQGGEVLVKKSKEFPTTEWLRKQKEVNYIGSLVILAITEVPDDWE